MSICWPKWTSGSGFDTLCSLNTVVLWNFQLLLLCIILLKPQKQSVTKSYGCDTSVDKIALFSNTSWVKQDLLYVLQSFKLSYFKYIGCHHTKKQPGECLGSALQSSQKNDGKVVSNAHGPSPSQIQRTLRRVPRV